MPGPPNFNKLRQHKTHDERLRVEMPTLQRPEEDDGGLLDLPDAVISAPIKSKLRWMGISLQLQKRRYSSMST